MDENDLMYGSLPDDSGFIGPFIQEADILDRPDLFYGSQGVCDRKGSLDLGIADLQWFSTTKNRDVDTGSFTHWFFCWHW